VEKVSTLYCWIVVVIQGLTCIQNEQYDRQNKEKVILICYTQNKNDQYDHTEEPTKDSMEP
jgi:hypothetical protein